MKPIFLAGILGLTLLSLTLVSFNRNQPNAAKNELSMQQDSLLRHVVLFKFKEGTTPEQISQVKTTFAALPSKIPQIKAYEWGLNNSPEGLEKGFTHCFFLTFTSEEDRAIYLPHPNHKAFGAVLSPFLEDVLVVDYWTK